jgi:hypothetical protein
MSAHSEFFEQMLQQLDELQILGNGFFERIQNSLERPYDFEEAKSDKQQLLTLLTNIEQSFKQRSLNYLPVLQEGEHTIDSLIEKYTQLLNQIESEKKRILRNAQNLKKQLKESPINPKS